MEDKLAKIVRDMALSSKPRRFTRGLARFFKGIGPEDALQLPSAEQMFRREG